MTPNQRDPDLDQIIDNLKDRLAALEANTVSRWGRGPHIAADPVTPPDGAFWIRTSGEWRYRANGVTVALDARYVAATGGWTTTFDPTLSQGVSTNIAHTLNRSHWHTDGDMIEWEGSFAATGTGTAGSAWTLTMPVAALSATNSSMGICYLFHGGVSYVCVVTTTSVSTMAFLPDGVAVDAWGITPNLAVAAGDQVRFRIRYRWR